MTAIYPRCTDCGRIVRDGTLPRTCRRCRRAAKVAASRTRHPSARADLATVRRLTPAAPPYDWESEGTA